MEMLVAAKSDGLTLEAEAEAITAERAKAENFMVNDQRGHELLIQFGIVSRVCNAHREEAYRVACRISYHTWKDYWMPSRPQSSTLGVWTALYQGVDLLPENTYKGRLTFQ